MAHTLSPKPVVLKKSLVGIAISIVLSIMILVLININRSTAAKQTVEKETPIRIVADQTDTRWYHDQEKSQRSTYPVLKKSFKADLHQPLPSSPETMSQQIMQDTLKAMQAPISSNQLSDNPKLFNVAETKMQTNQSDMLTSSQTEKRIFLKTIQHTFANDYVNHLLTDPINQFELKAGSVISGILMTGINSDLPGGIIGQVRSNVYDSMSGRSILIPQGAKVIGVYDSQVVYGQNRVMVIWKRIIFPNGQSINLGDMQGSDSGGYAGFNDKVNSHYGKMLGAVLLMSVLSTGAQLSQPPNNNNPFAAPTVGQTIAQSLGTNIANTANLLTSKTMEIKPTLEIRPGYEFNITVMKDLVFPKEYSA